MTPSAVSLTRNRRNNTLAGSSTCVRWHPPQRPRRGCNRPTPRTTRSRAQPHGPSMPPQPTAGHSNCPEPRAFSTAAPSSPTVITGALQCTKTALPCLPRRAGGPSPSQDVLTLTSHTTDGKTRRPTRSNREQHQLTSTRSSSASPAVNTRLHPAEPRRDPTHQTIEPAHPPGRVYAGSRGHRKIICCRHNSGSSSGGRPTPSTDTPKITNYGWNTRVTVKC
jgi:hypothetical protein